MPPWHDGLVDAFPIPLDRLSLEDRPGENEAAPINHTVPSQPDGPPFPFFLLPSEIRNRIYYLVLFTKPPYRNVRRPKRVPRTSILFASKRFHDEAAYVLYTFHTFRIFPLQDFTPQPTVRELPLQYRNLVTNIELILGPSWTAPPKSWVVNKPMAKILASMQAVSTLQIFVQIDPSHSVFANFRVSHKFYTDFCGKLLKDILGATPKLKSVQLDGNPSVKMDGPLLSRLRTEIESQNRTIKWGKERNWAVYMV